MVFMVFAPELGVEGLLPRVAAGRLAPTARPARAIKSWRRDRLASGLNGSVMGFLRELLFLSPPRVREGTQATSTRASMRLGAGEPVPVARRADPRVRAGGETPVVQLCAEVKRVGVRGHRPGVALRGQESP